LTLPRPHARKPNGACAQRRGFHAASTLNYIQFGLHQDVKQPISAVATPTTDSAIVAGRSRDWLEGLGPFPICYLFIRIICVSTMRGVPVRSCQDATSISTGAFSREKPLYPHMAIFKWYFHQENTFEMHQTML
jgi:hypothetical protein